MVEKVKIGELRSNARGFFQRDEINKLLNMHWLGTENAAVVDENTGKIELIDHPDMESLKDAQYRFCPNFSVDILVDMYSDGTYGNVRILK